MTLAEALVKLQAAGRLRRIYHPGMLYFATFGLPSRLDDRTPDVVKVATWTPLVDDPATRGCLLALLREASGKPSMLLVPHREEGEEPITEWTVEHLSEHVDWDDLDHFQPQPPYIVNAPTEGDAIVAAIVQLAEAL